MSEKEKLVCVHQNGMLLGALPLVDDGDATN
jgi:hypothetical protein